MASSWPSASAIAATTIGVAATGILAYAVYFDHRRRTDPEFRRELKRQSRRAARFDRSQAEAASSAHKQAIRDALAEAKTADYPTSNEEREMFFMEQVGQGERLSTDESTYIASAICFYKALRVYPTPTDLMNIYDQTVPKPVLDILAEMIAADSSIPVSARSGSAAGSQTALDD